MKVLHEPVTFNLEKEEELISLLEDEFNDAFVATTTQYKSLLNELSHEHKGVVLGCNTNCLRSFTGERVVFVGTGIFHPLIIKKNHNDKTIITVNPHTLESKKVCDKMVKKFFVREEVALNELKHGRKVGVIVSTKPGQCRLESSVKLKQELEEKGKIVYLFLFNTVNASEFHNFPGLDCLINTACPRMGLDDYGNFPVPVVNYELVLERYLTE